LRARKAVDPSNGISYDRPWIFLITDGATVNATSARVTGCVAVTP
jgi:uncharacterized protein YegL